MGGKSYCGTDCIYPGLLDVGGVGGRWLLPPRPSLQPPTSSLRHYLTPCTRPERGQMVRIRFACRKHGKNAMRCCASSRVQRQAPERSLQPVQAVFVRSSRREDAKGKARQRSIANQKEKGSPKRRARGSPTRAKAKAGKARGSKSINEQ